MAKQESPHLNLKQVQMLFARSNSNRSANPHGQPTVFDSQNSSANNPVYSMYANSKKSLNLRSYSQLNQIRETDQDMEQLMTLQHQSSQGLNLPLSNNNFGAGGNQSTSSNNGNTAMNT